MRVRKNQLVMVREREGNTNGYQLIASMPALSCSLSIQSYLTGPSYKRALKKQNAEFDLALFAPHIIDHKTLKDKV